MIFSRRASITNLMALKTIRVEFNKGRHFSIDAIAYPFVVWSRFGCTLSSISKRTHKLVRVLFPFFPSLGQHFVFRAFATVTLSLSLTLTVPLPILYVYIIFPFYFWPSAN